MRTPFATTILNMFTKTARRRSRQDWRSAASAARSLRCRRRISSQNRSL